ncbi:MAG TPA: glycosyl hydrolase [Verrucomicrobiota bacterium]|nr:glycosyl hydrolase [Verrucomicrobiota bacterium]HNU50355.1 glycosyl hydrolase [Verrucomicrobiota bacterium]
MNFLTWLSVVLLGLLCLPEPGAGEPSWTTLEHQFRELPPEARRLTGPLFWLHGDESRERLEGYVAKVAEGGNGSFTTESRPHRDWLGEGWFRDVAICLAAAKQHDLKLWIFDEKWWPSQGVAGNVPPQYAAKQLQASAVDVTGPSLFEADGYAGESSIAAVAGRVADDGAIDGRSLIDLAGSVHNGRLAWNVPEGQWRVMKFTYTLAPGLGQGGGRELSVDGLSPECVEWYLRTVYAPHYDRFKEDFGKTIVGFFYDEPETRGDWGTALNPVLAELGVDWKQAYVAYKFTLSGEAQAAARYQFLEARAEAWGRTMYGGITRWCQQRGVESIGHFMEHGGMCRLQDFCAGDLMRVQKYSSMGGIDAVFSQFKMGQRAAYDAPCWQTPKLGSSITHAYGKPQDITMVEIFGARGQDLTYPEMKWWADHMHVSGVNFLIPHSFNPRAPRDTDCPPYFYNGGFEPRWPLYRVFADYTSRLSLLLTGGRHVCPVALLSPGQSLHTGKGTPIDDLSESLQDALYDCDWLPYEVFEKDTRVQGKALELRAEAYRVLVVPAVEVIPLGVLTKARAYFEAGGVVVGYGLLPSVSATPGRGAADLAALRDAIWGKAEPGLGACKTSARGGRSYFLPAKPSPEQLQQVLAGDAGIHPTLEVLEGETDHWLHVLHRVRSGRDVFFIANQNHLGAPRTFRFRIAAEGEPECWDAMRNEITALPCERSGRHAVVSLTLEPNESVLLVFQPQKRPIPPRDRLGAGSKTREIPVARQPVAPPPEPMLEPASPFQKLFQGRSWVWYPEGNPAQAAPPGVCGFRRTIELPEGRKPAQALFAGTADNSFVLFVNGAEAGRSDSSSEGWRNPVQLDLKAHLRPGANVLAIRAINASTQPNPAGLLGCLRVEFDTGEPLVVPVDRSWKTSRDPVGGWTAAAFDDSGWKPAAEAAPYGSAPWSAVGVGPLTLSPVKADPFVGSCQIPADLDWRRGVHLVMDGVAPEAAARVTLNGRDAGGAIGLPLRLDVSPYLKTGANTVRIEPFAPRTVRLVVCE